MERILDNVKKNERKYLVLYSGNISFVSAVCKWSSPRQSSRYHTDHYREGQVPKRQPMRQRSCARETLWMRVPDILWHAQCFMKAIELVKLQVSKLLVFTFPGLLMVHEHIKQSTMSVLVVQKFRKGRKEMDNWHSFCQFLFLLSQTFA